METLKKICYWLSLVCPIVDIFKGAVKGVILGLEDLKNKDKEQFYKDNRDEL